MVQRWLVTGASGQLGPYVVREIVRGGRATPAAVQAWCGRAGAAPALGDDPLAGAQVVNLDLLKYDEVWRTVRALRPTHVMHVAAMTAVGDCYADPAQADRGNVQATAVLAGAAAACGARFVLTSTDMVFGGDAAPYRETDAPRPLSRYGASKVAAEGVVRATARSVVARVPLLYGIARTTRATTFMNQLAALRAGKPLKLFTDEFRTPVWLGDAARALVGLAESEFEGVIHVGGAERLSRYEMIERVAHVLGLPTAPLVPISSREVVTPEPRPADLSLAGELLAREFASLVPGPVRAEALA